MKAILLAACVVSVLSAIGPATAQDITSPGPNRNSHSQSALDGAMSSRIALGQAVELAEKSAGARAVSAIFTPFATGGGSHDIVVLRRDGMLAHYHIDANNGAFVGVTDKQVASLMTKLTPQAIGEAKVSMLRAIALVEGRSPDQRAIGAEAAQDGTSVAYEVTVATRDGDVGLHVSSMGDVTD